MNVRSHNDMMRNFAAWTDAVNRALDQKATAYNYAQNGGNNGGSVANAAGNQTVRLPVDIWTDEGAFHIAAYLPGVNPDDVEITIEAEELTIRGHLPEVDSETTYIRRELYHGVFERRLNFNVAVDVEQIEANFSNGLLTLRVPKAEAILPKQIKVHAK